MDLNALDVRVQASRLLTEQEKQYWCGNLQRMNPEQIAKLEAILAEAEALPWSKQMESYLQIATKATAAIAA